MLGQQFVKPLQCVLLALLLWLLPPLLLLLLLLLSLCKAGNLCYDFANVKCKQMFKPNDDAGEAENEARAARAKPASQPASHQNETKMAITFVAISIIKTGDFVGKVEREEDNHTAGRYINAKAKVSSGEPESVKRKICFGSVSVLVSSVRLLHGRCSKMKRETNEGSGSGSGDPIPVPVSS